MTAGRVHIFSLRNLGGHGKIGDITSLAIEMIECPADIVPRIVEKYKETPVDFLHVGAFSGMQSGQFHTRDVNVVPPKGVDELVNYSAYNFHRGSAEFLKLCNDLPNPWRGKCLN